MKADKIYIVGFMGAGKSTVAHALGARLGWEVVDLDSLIEQREGRSIATIFDDDGEPAFRRLERELLQELVPRRDVVVATGGGTFVDATNRALIAGDGVSVWLDVSFETVVQRIPSDGRRPLARDRTTMQTLWRERRAVYELAQFHVDTDHATVDEVVARVVEWMES